MMLLTSVIVFDWSHRHEATRADPYPDASTDGLNVEHTEYHQSPAHDGSSSAPTVTSTAPSTTESPTDSSLRSTPVPTTGRSDVWAPGLVVSVAALRVVDGADAIRDLVASDVHTPGPALDIHWTPGSTGRLQIVARTPKYLLPQIDRVGYLLPSGQVAPRFDSDGDGEVDTGHPHCIMLPADQHAPHISVHPGLSVVAAESVENFALGPQDVLYFECPTDPGVFGIDATHPPTVGVSVVCEYEDLLLAESDHPAFVSQWLRLDEHSAIDRLAGHHPAETDAEAHERRAYGWSEMSDARVSVHVQPETGTGAVHTLLPNADEVTTTGHVLHDRLRDGHLSVIARWREGPVDDRSGFVQLSLLTAGAALSLLAETVLRATGAGRGKIRLIAVLALAVAVGWFSGDTIARGLAAMGTAGIIVGFVFLAAAEPE